MAALASFILGAAWYAPALFGRAWMAANELTEETLSTGNAAAVFAGGYALTVISALVLAALLPADADFWSGLASGALLASGLIASALGVIYLFERKPLRLYLINAGFQVCALALSGAILGAWR